MPMRAMQSGASEAAEADRPEQDALEHAEHAAEHVIRDDALEERQGGDVGDRVPDPDDARTRAARRDSSTKMPITANGTPNSTTPIPKSAASRPRVASTSATKPPTKPPIPSAALR